MNRPCNKVFDFVPDELKNGQIQNVVFTNGCFDILHNGHKYYLEKSKELGDLLVVGLNSDDSVTRLKGSSRPVNPWEIRADFLSRLNCVDIIIKFEEDTPLELIYMLRPKVITKGGDYTYDEMIGSDFVESYGGKVVIIPYQDGHSSSAIIQEMNSSQLS